MRRARGAQAVRELLWPLLGKRETGEERDPDRPSVKNERKPADHGRVHTDSACPRTRKPKQRRRVPSQDVDS